MLARTVAGAVMGIIAAALILVGVAFAGFAIFTALEHPVGVPGAAALTALILLIGPLLFVFVASFRQPPKNQIMGETLLLNLFSGLAKDKPLLAMLGAGLFGAAGIFLRKRR
jgi:LPXTG-motif cell wall-anchored protein